MKAHPVQTADGEFDLYTVKRHSRISVDGTDHDLGSLLRPHMVWKKSYQRIESIESCPEQIKGVVMKTSASPREGGECEPVECSVVLPIENGWITIYCWALDGWSEGSEGHIPCPNWPEVMV